MSSVTAIEQCRIMASWFSNVSNEVEQQALILSGVALQTRINLLQLTMRDRDTQAILTARYPSMQVFALVDEPAFANAARYIETRSQQMQAPFGRARGFLSAPGMLDAERLQAYFEDVANDAVTRADASSFLRVARHVQSPLLDALHDITLGGEPPSVSTVRMGQS